NIFEISAASRRLLQLPRRIPQYGSGSAGLAVDEDESRTLDAVVPPPLDAEVGVGLLDVDGFGIPVPCERRGEPILPIEQPGIPCLGGEEDKLPERNDSSIVSCCAPLNVAYLIGETKVFALNHALARSTPDWSSGGGHGTLPQAVRRSSRLRLSLLRSYRHPWLFERSVTT